MTRLGPFATLRVTFGEAPPLCRNVTLSEAKRP